MNRTILFFTVLGAYCIGAGSAVAQKKLPYKDVLETNISNGGNIEISPSVFYPDADFSIDLSAKLEQSGDGKVTVLASNSHAFGANLTISSEGIKFVEGEKVTNLSHTDFADGQEHHYRVSLDYLARTLYIYVDGHLEVSTEAFKVGDVEVPEIYDEVDSQEENSGIYDSRNLLRNPGFEDEDIVYSNDVTGSDDYMFWPKYWDIYNGGDKENGWNVSVRCYKDNESLAVGREGHSALMFRQDGGGGYTKGSSVFQTLESGLRAGRRYVAGFKVMSHSNAAGFTYAVGVGTAAGTWNAMYEEWKAPANVNEAGDYAFAYNNRLANINLENAVNKIGNYAFYQNTSLSKANLINAIEIGDYAFAECRNLIDVNLETIEVIGSYAFSKVDSKATAPTFTSITLGASLKEIKAGAFSEANKLESITLPEGLTSLGSSAFANCQALTTVDLPTTLNYIAENAFSNCSKLADINLENIITIADGAFINDTNLTNVNLAKTTTINYGAFANTNLTNINNANLVNYIGDYAFQGTDMTSISLPNLSYIGSAAFSNCLNLTSFTISNKLTHIGHNVFFGSTRLETFNYDDNGTLKRDGEVNDYVRLSNGVLYTYLENGSLALSQVPAALNIETLQVLDNTKVIEPYAGNMNKNIVNLVFPDTLEVISNFAFYDYDKLETVEFRTFTAPKLESYIIEDGEIEIGDPGYELFNYAYHLFTNPYPYYQFVDRVGTINNLTLILPANEGLIGYDTLIYEGYFGDISEAIRSDYEAKDNNTLAFLGIIDQIPSVDNVSVDDEELITNAVTILNALTQDLTKFGYTADEVTSMKNKIEDARYKLYELLRNQGSSAVRNVQSSLDNLDTTFKLSDLNKLKDIASQMNSLSRDERNILDLRKYNQLVASYNEYLAMVEADAEVVDNITTNGFDYSAVVALVAQTSMLGISLALLFKGLL